MLLGMVPISPIASAAEVKSVTYKFQQNFRTDSPSGWLENGDGSWHSVYKGFPTNPSDPGMMWAYLGHAGKNPVGSTFVNMTTYVGTNRGDAEEWTAFRIKAPTNGTYTLSSGTAYKYSNATKSLKIYLFPLEGEYANVFKEGNTSTYGTIGADTKRTGQKLFGALNVPADSLIGATNIYSATDESGASIELSDVKQNFELEYGKEYVLLLRAETAGAQTISTLTFNYTEKKDELTAIEPQFDDVAVGEKVFPKSIVWKSENKSIDGSLGTVKVEIEEDKGGILKVDNGEIYALDAGKATVKVTGTLDGISKSATVEISALHTDEVTYSFTKTGRPEGIGGLEYAADGRWQDAMKKFPEDPISPGQMWAYLGHGGKNAVSGSWFVTISTYVGTNRGDADEWTAFKIKVPVDGRYTLTSATAYKYSNATKDLKMYLIPLEGEYAETLAEGNADTYGTVENGKRSGHKSFSELGVSGDYLIASSDIYASADVTEEMSLFNVKDDIELEADKEYALLFRAEKAGAQTVSALTFTYKERLYELTEIEADFGDVVIGEKLVPENIVWKSGEKIIDGKRGKTVFEMVEDNDGILYTGNDGNIYAVDAGTVRMKVTGTLYGISKEHTVDINIREPLEDEYAKLSTVSTILSDAELAVGESTKIVSSVGKDKDGNDVDISDAYIEYRVADEYSDIIELSNDGKSVKAIGNGFAKLHAFIIKGGAVLEAETDINIGDEFRVENVYLYSVGTTAPGDKLSFEVRLEQKNKKFVSGGTIIAYEIVEQSENGIAEVSENGSIVTAKKEGTVKLKADVDARGIIRESDTITVIIKTEAGRAEYPASFTIDFRQNAYKEDSATRVNQLTEYSAYRNWKFYEFKNFASDSEIIYTAADRNYTQIVWDSSASEKYIAFMVKFPTSGEYTVDVTSLSRYRSPKLELYIMPATDTLLSDISGNLVLENQYFFGSADLYRADDELDVVSNFGTEMVEEAGEYLVVFKAVASKGASDAWYPFIINFTNEAAMSSAKLCTENGETSFDASQGAVATHLELYNKAGEEIEYTAESITRLHYSSSDESVATVSDDGVITPLNDGTATIFAVITRDGITTKAGLEINVEDTSGIVENGIHVSAAESVYVYGQAQLRVYATMNSGNITEIPAKYITWQHCDGSDTETVEISEDGLVTGKKVGNAILLPVIDASYKNSGEIVIEPINLSVVWDASINPQITTLKERENAAVNAKKYSWARAEVRAATENADRYLESIDTIYDMISPEGLFRFYFVGHSNDPLKYYCRYCGCNIGLEYGTYGWSISPLTRPWKIQCPDCKRLFPSNDFGSFYKLGLSENGLSWSMDKALWEHHKRFVCENGENCECSAPSGERGSEEWYSFYGYGVSGSYLYNELYGELNDPRWGVDDSMGYLQKYVSEPTAMGFDSRYLDSDGDGLAEYKDGSLAGPVQHTYIAYYLHEGIWYGAGGSNSPAVVKKAIQALSNAFTLTGEAKYGRAGAILLDRVADVYPGFDWYQWKNLRGDTYRGTIVDPVWSCSLSTSFARAYDAFLPIYNDPYISEYVREKRTQYKTDGTENPKDSPGALRKHIEDNLLLAIFDAAKKGNIRGNFGMTKQSIAAAALGLNRLPETGEMLEWITATGVSYATGPEREEPIEGANLYQRLIEEVNRDGHGYENAPGYNLAWISNLLALAELLEGYELYPAADLFNNPKFMKMFDAQLRLTLGGYYAPQTGDSAATASKGILMNSEAVLAAFEKTGDVFLAQALYMQNGNTVDGIHGTIFDINPEKVQEDIQLIIDTHGEFKLSSDMMTGYGFAALRAGNTFNSAASSTETNTNRDFALYFGANDRHGHLDSLNLYMSAFGLNVAPDLGYPEQTGDQPNRYEWVHPTISHNTVVVDKKGQQYSTVSGTPHHFDDSGRVKLMDIDANKVYPNTDEYRRTVFMVQVDDENSYGVDFFHIKGGSDHLFSFHSQSDELYEILGLDAKSATPMYEDDEGNLYGTYAGADVKYGADPGGLWAAKYERGSTWLYNVRTFNEISKDFAVEFKVKDWNKALKSNRDIRLRLTMLGDEPASEVTFATALPPQRAENKNIGELDYLLVRRKGTNLDTTFTTVFEPYDSSAKYIAQIEKVPMERVEESKPGLNDSYGAVKVVLKSGRTDYIIYSTNNEVDYLVDNKIAFRGFGGIMSLETLENEEKIVYSYLNDGEVLKLEDDMMAEESTAAYIGIVDSFTTELSDENYIVFIPEDGQNVDVNNLADRYVYVDNDGVQNAAYKIEYAEEENGKITLSLGNTTLIRNYVDAYDMDLGYNYNIARGQSLRIPLSSTYDTAPVVERPQDYTTSAGSSVSIPISAYSPVEKDISVVGTTLPRGMSINEETMTLTWKPTSSQVGENHVAITVTDGTMETTVHFTVTVYGSTTSKPSQDNAGTDSSNTTDTPTGGGGGGGGGGAAPAPDEGDNTGDGTDVPSDSTGDNTDVGDDAIIVPSKGFVDLGNHTWAEAAINELAENGIIKGTSDSTFSPANNITRADFAVLLVRAFELKSDNTENFADVTKSDYFASELAIARNCGIVGGIGDNKYAPRNTITRQDMMVIVYRALSSTLVGEGLRALPLTDGVLYPDFDTVSPYATDAVSALVGAGLVNGKNGRIAPTDYTTRAEVAVLIKRILDYIKK